MSDPRTRLSASLHGLRRELPPSAQAQLTIPTGTVGRLRQSFEALIATHSHDLDSILITRALHNTDALIRQHRTYAQHLHLIETLGLPHLPSHLRAFLNDHDNLHRATIRSRQRAKVLMQNQDTDVLTLVAARILNTNNVYCLALVRCSRAPAARTRIMLTPFFRSELQTCTDRLVDELVRLLQRLAELQSTLPADGDDVELENVGEDHDVAALGYELPVPETQIETEMGMETETTANCPICLSPYTPSHPPFRLTRCAHTLGTPCLATWLNGTAANSTTCPCCRAELCVRRARRPCASVRASIRDAHAEQGRLSGRVRRAWGLLADLDALCAVVWEGVGGRWFAEAVGVVRGRCAERGVVLG
tara:strand:- start:2503 stop:3591 length:1089 start_codon:yes stop_codon:yes gene_type:complete